MSNNYRNLLEDNNDKVGILSIIEERKKTAFPSMESVNDFKRKKDDISEQLRKQDRASRFSDKRRKQDSEPSEVPTEETKESKDIEMQPPDEYVNRFNSKLRPPTAGDLPDIFIAIKGSDLRIRGCATRYLRSLLASNKEPSPEVVQTVFDSGLIPYLIEMIRDDSNHTMQVLFDLILV